MDPEFSKTTMDAATNRGGGKLRPSTQDQSLLRRRSEQKRSLTTWARFLPEIRAGFRGGFRGEAIGSYHDNFAHQASSHHGGVGIPGNMLFYIQRVAGIYILLRPQAHSLVDGTQLWEATANPTFDEREESGVQSCAFHT